MKRLSTPRNARGRGLPVGGGHYELRPRTILVVAIFFAVYLASLYLKFTEAERRSVSLEIPPTSADYLQIDVNVVHVDLGRSEITTRISFRFAGQLAQDELTPAADLQLALNTVTGQQQFNFAKGQRINPIEAVFPLQGEVTFYPFDHHKGILWLFVTMPGRQPATSEPNQRPGETVVPEEVTKSPSLPVSTISLERRVWADTRATFTASVPGLTFRGSQSVQSVEALKGLTGIEVTITRSSGVVLISVTTMLMMAAMAVGLLMMVLRIVGGSQKMETYHLPVAVSLIFGLPALRNIQPDVPPQGTFGDAIAFTWAEIAAAVCAIALIVHWLLHRPTHGQSSEK